MPTLHSDTFNYVKPSGPERSDMQACRDAAADYADVLDRLVPDGPDKTYLLRKLREVAMWANIAISRQVDGTPRDGEVE